MAAHVSLSKKLQSRQTFLLENFDKDVDDIVDYLVSQQAFKPSQGVYQLLTFKQSTKRERFRLLLENLTTDHRRKCFLRALARTSTFPQLERKLAAPPESYLVAENTLTRADWENTDAEEAARALPRDIHGRQETVPPLASLPGGDDPPPAYTASGSGGSTGTLISSETGADGTRSLEQPKHDRFNNEYPRPVLRELSEQRHVLSAPSLTGLPDDQPPAQDLLPISDSRNPDTSPTFVMSPMAAHTSHTGIDHTDKDAVTENCDRSVPGMTRHGTMLLVGFGVVATVAAWCMRR
ncbi:uncharacterized protein LOC135805372 isoform X1 [Sycon ciliatum]|uniref:uncharacterized protein LOC135805372 isoform X1 n=1 Tax=Sycon ciliatum TaxID=27933 RepID=UPI0031F68E76